MNEDIITTLEAMLVQGEKTKEEMLSTLEAMLVGQKNGNEDIVNALEALIVQGNEHAQHMKEMMQDKEKEMEDDKESEKTITFKLDPSSIKGEKGDKPTKEEIIELIKPLIPEPKEGVPGRNPLTVSKIAPENPQVGDIWYKTN